MPKFRKKPVIIEAYRLDDQCQNAWELIMWAHEGLHALNNSIITAEPGGLMIRTLEGYLHASPGDWIIKGVKGEFYPCKPDVFEQIYERAE